MRDSALQDSELDAVLSAVDEHVGASQAVLNDSTRRLANRAEQVWRARTVQWVPTEPSACFFTTGLVDERDH